MDATPIAIDSDAQLTRARTLVDRLMASDKPVDLARLEAPSAADRGLRRSEVAVGRRPARPKSCDS